MTIAKIIEKLEKAEGADRRLDDAIHDALWDGTALAPLYTASIDAAVQLCERVLPRHDLLIDQYRGEWMAAVTDRFEKKTSTSKSNCKNGAIATCQVVLHALRALQTKEGQ